MVFHKHNKTLSSSIFETVIATYSEKGYNYHHESENSQLNSINITLLLVTLICLRVVSFLSLSPLLFF